jgi:hypothetical protein
MDRIRPGIERDQKDEMGLSQILLRDRELEFVSDSPKRSCINQSYRHQRKRERERGKNKHMEETHGKRRG